MNASSGRPGTPSSEDGESSGSSSLATMLGLLFGFDKRTVLILLWLLLVIAVLYGLLIGT